MYYTWPADLYKPKRNRKRNRPDFFLNRFRLTFSSEIKLYGSSVVFFFFYNFNWTSISNDRDARYTNVPCAIYKTNEKSTRDYARINVFNFLHSQPDARKRFFLCDGNRWTVPKVLRNILPFRRVVTFSNPGQKKMLELPKYLPLYWVHTQTD